MSDQTVCRNLGFIYNLVLEAWLITAILTKILSIKFISSVVDIKSGIMPFTLNMYTDNIQTMDVLKHYKIAILRRNISY